METTLGRKPLVRDIDAGEAAFFDDNGWVKLERLISAELAGQLLTAAKTTMAAAPLAQERVGLRGRETAKRHSGQVTDARFWQAYHFAARDDRTEPFASLVFSNEMGKAVQTLMGRDVAVRYHNDLLACKMPEGQVGGQKTDWHQDLAYPFDRTGGVSIWIALSDVPPERGAMRFLSGSHREGPLGRTHEGDRDVLEAYPRLAARYPLSPPLHLRPGDATAHKPFVCHSAPVNSTDEPRFAYIIGYFPGDTRYTAAPNYNFDNLGLEFGKVIDHPNFPVVS